MSSTLQAFGRTSHWSCCHAYDSAAGSRKRTRLATTGRNRLASESEQHAAPSVQARAAPLTWAYDLSTSEPTSPPSWQAARPTPAEEEQPHLDRKPLKINRDLLLVGTQSFAEPRTTAVSADSGVKRCLSVTLAAVQALLRCFELPKRFACV